MEGSLLGIRTRSTTKTKRIDKQLTIELLHKQECKACPLNKVVGLMHPKMEPTGSDDPVVYMLGEAPGADEDAAGEQFIGRAGRTLRGRIPRDWKDHIRWNNCVRTRPHNNETPNDVMIECCRPSVIRDIEATMPAAIFGFGNIPLRWALGPGMRITDWRGRWFPIRVGNHECWFFPMFHPSYVNRKQNEFGGDEVRYCFELDLRNAFSMVENMPVPRVHTADDAYSGVEYVTGHGADDFDKVLDFLEKVECTDTAVGVDYETKGTRPYGKDAKILTVALSANFGTLAFPVHHPGAGWVADDRSSIEEALVSTIERTSAKLAVHHLAFELEWTAFFWGNRLVRAANWQDTLSQAYILDERQNCFSLDFLTQQYFGLSIKSLGPALDKNNLDKEKLDDVLVYNGIDAKYHRLLYLKQAKRLRVDGMMPVYEEHLERVPTMVLTQLLGVPVYDEAVQELHKKYMGRRTKVEQQIAEMPEAVKFKKVFGAAFRPSAPADIKKVVERVIGVPCEGTTEEKLKPINHPLVKAVLKWRHNNKILSTYIKPVTAKSKFVYNGKIHPIISTTKTRTWRTSTEEPSVQNWPKRDSQRKEVRRQIRPKAGFKIVSFDYGQIQARNVGMESQDAALLKAFWDDYDIHAAWRDRIAEVHPRWLKAGVGRLSDKDAAKAKRHEAKNKFVFPLFFGASENAITGYLNIPKPKAVKLRNEFWQMFPDIKGWHDFLRESYRINGYVTGLTGFRRHAPVGYNEMINAPIQADEAAIVCDAMNRLSMAGHQAVMEIHDDLTFIWKEDEVHDRAKEVVKIMLDCPFEWANIVPIVVEMSVGDDWNEQHEVGVFASNKWDGAI